jgi:peroxiredoxin
MKILFIAVFIIISGLSGLHAGGDEVANGSAAPTFSLPGLDQKYVSLRDYCGEELRKPWLNKEKYVVVLSFFATWCKPCMEELPHLEKVAETCKNQSVKIFLIDVGEDLQKVTDFVGRKKISLPVLIDRYQTVAEKYDALTLPRLFVIDREGVIRKENKGFSDPDTFEHEITDLIDSLLVQKP